MPFSERFSVVKRNRLCLLCLLLTHFWYDVNENIFVEFYNSSNYNSLLHKKEQFLNVCSANKTLMVLASVPASDSSECIIENEISQQGKQINLLTCFVNSNKYIILPTVVIMIKIKNCHC